MAPVIRAGSHRRSAGILLLIVIAAGCMTWSSGNSGLEGVLAKRPERVRVTLSDGERVELDSPVLRGDSLLGFRSERRIAVALDQVRSVELRRVSATRTALLVGAGVTLLIIARNVAEEDPPAPPPSTGPPVSCPLVYSWDGASWRLDSGTFGGAITESLARTDVDNLDYATATDEGIVRLKVANELAETDYLDALRLLVVDHAPGTVVAPTPGGSLLALGSLRTPRAVRDFRGRDAIERVAVQDGWSWESSLSEQGNLEGPRDGLELEFNRPADAVDARLVVDAHNTPWASFLLTEYLRAHGDGLDAWYAALDADPERARRFFGRIAEEAFLEVSIWTRDGWRAQGLAWEAGPELVKRQVIPIDLRGVEGETVRIRLAAPPSFWLIDHVAIDYGPAPSVVVQELTVAQARTRDGLDVLAEISAPDGRSWTIETGDWAEVTFRAPAPAKGRARTFLLASTGWYRVDARRGGPPDRVLLSRFEREPGAIARISLERRQDAVAELRGTR